MFNGQKNYQEVVVTGKLYKVSKRAVSNGTSEQLAPSIEVIGNSIDIYASQAEDAAAPANMILDEIDFIDLRAFSLIPNYIYFADNSGTPTSIILSGLDVKEVL